tara:strand:- start:117 stop:605 length:489 start_codon:yes stop_codon:yes gene_type:complete
MAFNDLLIHRVNTYQIKFNGADDYNNPIRIIEKDDSNSNINCRVQHQISKQKAYSLSEIELLEEVPVNAFISSGWEVNNSNHVLGVSFVGDFTDESFYLIKALESKYDSSSIHHYELSIIPSSEFTKSDIIDEIMVSMDSLIELEEEILFSSDFQLESNIAT